MSEIIREYRGNFISSTTPDLIQVPHERQKSVKETVVFESIQDAVGIPDYAELVERKKQENLYKLQNVLRKIRNIKLDRIYYEGQARQFGFSIGLDPSRINGELYRVPQVPQRQNYSSDQEYENARSKFADALSSQEKYALSGVPFN